jgi:hypothetical protein
VSGLRARAGEDAYFSVDLSGKVEGLRVALLSMESKGVELRLFPGSCPPLDKQAYLPRAGCSASKAATASDPDSCFRYEENQKQLWVDDTLGAGYYQVGVHAPHLVKKTTWYIRATFKEAQSYEIEAKTGFDACVTPSYEEVAGNSAGGATGAADKDGKDGREDTAATATAGTGAETGEGRGTGAGGKAGTGLDVAKSLLTRCAKHVTYPTLDVELGEREADPPMPSPCPGKPRDECPCEEAILEAWCKQVFFKCDANGVGVRPCPTVCGSIQKHCPGNVEKGWEAANKHVNDQICNIDLSGITDGLEDPEGIKAGLHGNFGGAENCFPDFVHTVRYVDSSSVCVCVCVCVYSSMCSSYLLKFVSRI